MPTTTATVTRESVDVAGRTRTFTTVETPGAARPLLLVFHGSRQTGDVHRDFTGGAYDALAESGQAVVAYLDGHRGNWNDARSESYFPARKENIDDVGFARAVVELLSEHHRIDREKVFALGYSNGGQMVIRLAHEAPGLLAGAAVLAATMPVPDNFLAEDPSPTPLPVLLIHGTKDPIVSYEGGGFPWWQRKFFKVGGLSLSAPQTAVYFAERNGITATPTTSRLPQVEAGDPTEVERTSYRQEGRPPVVLYTVHGGGHTIPGPARVPGVLGKTSHHVNTAELVGEFFGLGG
ncbi:alpha/beta hydrolase family esterase [Lentzea albida]|uniref:Polyhydroxybutyrate depolymerase n=1 Tax=Lentzea albida TaxID=65499 RepID=A0A1H9K1J2_9PSEU|nr:PHB depolymerase family esterase [Lentzea albida]SEQ93002.1 polyhydroxybutyrate depolymerase [Lentzea albida]